MALTLVADNYSPIVVGDTLNPFSCQFAQYQNVNGVLTLEPINLTGLTISMSMTGVTTGTTKTAANAWVIDNATQGLAHYPWNAADVNTADRWVLNIALTNGSGQVAHAYTKVLDIEPLPL